MAFSTPPHGPGVQPKLRFPSIIHALIHHSEVQPEHLALTEGSEVLTWRELRARVEAQAMWLTERGVGRRDLTVIIGDNRVGWVVAFLAAMRIGAIAVPMNNRMAPAQVAELMNFLGVRMALSDEAHGSLFDLCPEIEVIDFDQAQSADASAVTLPALPDAQEAALLSFTSGTTGIPKGAVISHDALSQSGTVYKSIIEGDETSSTLIVAPLFHNTGFVDQLATMLVCGGRTDLLRRFRTALAVEQLGRRPVNFITAVPSVIRMMVVAEGADLVFGRAKDVFFGGSPMPAAWIDEMRVRWPHLRLWHGYGLTEFTSCCTCLPPELVSEYGESIGYPVQNVELRLVGEKGTDVPDGEVGEIWVAGPTRMVEYWRRPEQTAEKTRDKWLLTGDLAVRRNKGLLYHVGRKDDVINRGGEKILPAYVESVLANFPAVALASVFAMPNPILQNSVIAAVELRDGVTLDRDALMAHLKANLPGYAVPEDVMISADLPRTGSGKLDRRAIRDLYIEQTDKKA
jgi:long-chain acyl-CoA synthetase